MQTILPVEIENEITDLRGLVLDAEDLSIGARRRIMETFKKKLDDIRLAYSMPQPDISAHVPYERLSEGF